MNARASFRTMCTTIILKAPGSRNDNVPKRGYAGSSNSRRWAGLPFFTADLIDQTLILFFNVRNPVVMFFISYPGTFKWPVARPPGLFYFWRIVCMFASSSPKRYPLICEKVKSSLFCLLRPYFFGLQERPGCGGRLPRDHGGLRFTRSR